MLERYLVEHCSPTLACLKSANMFSLPCADRAEAERAISDMNGRLGGKGVELILLRYAKGLALIYAFRRGRLAAELEKEDVKSFLRQYGYRGGFDGAIERLKDRLSGGQFPHEIGVFLDYPLGDVKGFIENGGKNCKCCGCWKVYCDECGAKKTFSKYKKCREVYRRLWNSGTRSISQLTVKDY